MLYDTPSIRDFFKGLDPGGTPLYMLRFVREHPACTLSRRKPSIHPLPQCYSRSLFIGFYSFAPERTREGWSACERAHDQLPHAGRAQAARGVGGGHSLGGGE